MSNTLTPFDALREAVDRAGSQSAFARSLGVAQPTVWKWLHRSKEIPAEHVLKAETLYGVSRHQLRPDIYPIDLPPFAPREGQRHETEAAPDFAPTPLFDHEEDRK